MSPLEEFDAAVAKVNDARGSVYGHPADDFRRAAEIKRVLAECQDAELRHTLEMIGSRWRGSSRRQTMLIHGWIFSAMPDAPP